MLRNKVYRDGEIILEGVTYAEAMDTATNLVWEFGGKASVVTFTKRGKVVGRVIINEDDVEGIKINRSEFYIN